VLISSSSTNKLKFYVVTVVHFDQFKEHKALFRLYKSSKKKNYVIVTNFIFLINFENIGLTVRTLVQVLDH
jgi:hypothetical protein